MSTTMLFISTFLVSSGLGVLIGLAAGLLMARRRPLPAAFIQALIHQAHIDLGRVEGTELAARLLEEATRRTAPWGDNEELANHGRAVVCQAIEKLRGPS